jgi:hypothetical protein
MRHKRLVKNAMSIDNDLSLRKKLRPPAIAVFVVLFGILSIEFGLAIFALSPMAPRGRPSRARSRELNAADLLWLVRLGCHSGLESRMNRDHVVFSDAKKRLCFASDPIPARVGDSVLGELMMRGEFDRILRSSAAILMGSIPEVLLLVISQYESCSALHQQADAAFRIRPTVDDVAEREHIAVPDSMKQTGEFVGATVDVADERERSRIGLRIEIHAPHRRRAGEPSDGALAPAS